jgi:predicted enzyme related to lactoylglutathione lyase
MEHVTGVGGVFFRARDARALAAWYAEHLGVPVGEEGWYAIFPESRDTHWAAFSEDTDYWPAEKQLMVNFTVRDLEVDERVEEHDFGRFGWAVDPEGNRFELWEPPAG